MKKLILIVMDGWGCGQVPAADAIAAALTPNLDSYYKNYPHAFLTTHGTAVGLPDGQMGNSEVGHLNIGAGRIVYQELQRINRAIEIGELETNEALTNCFKYCKSNSKPLHLIGLVSDGGVHSHINHLKALCMLAKQNGLNANQIFIHAFTDGRDCDPQSGIEFINELNSFLNANACGHIATVCGRYYAMDRDNRWERVKVAYDMMTSGVGEKTTDILQSIKNSYTNGVTDEFMQPIVQTDKSGMPYAQIWNDDAVLCFNFRTDRCREIARALTQENFLEQGMKKLKLHFTTMTEYDKRFENVNTIFKTDNLEMTLGEWIAKNGGRQIRIAETEKYPHVSFFFSGGREQPFNNETRIMVPSPKVATYDLQPEMSAREVTQRILEEIKKESAEFICLNFANTDMVGHTGVFKAAVKAAETVDSCVGDIVQEALVHNYNLLITADHGNADYMINDDGSPNTSHTKNPVPIFVICQATKKLQLKNGKLADIAPTICTLMGLDIPPQMSGDVLITNQ